MGTCISVRDPPSPSSSLRLPPVVETPSIVFSYGYDRDRIRRRCRLHKLDDMVDVKSPRCEMMGCRKQPCCGFPGLKPRFCSEHKQDGMLNLKVLCAVACGVVLFCLLGSWSCTAADGFMVVEVAACFQGLGW